VAETPHGKIRFGLFPGSGDLIGWVSRTITPEMVGQKMAQFVSIENKTSTGRVAKNQSRWCEAVMRDGGISVIARDPNDVEFLEKIK
jgi:hypothetical protein